MILAPGDILQDRYRVVSLLGAGGMGAVFRGYDTRLDVAVAIKEMTVQPGLDDVALDQLRQQFQQEARVLARLRHPNLVHVSDYFVQGGNAYLVMDFIEGESLADLIAHEGALPEARVLAWAEALLSALAYCHRLGVIHRDVKPHNVIITSDGSPVLVDFGLVKLWDPGNPVTQTAVRGMGTLEYAPPEQYSVRGGHTDPRSDVYSLGSTMYHALTGQAPPTATDRMAEPGRFVPVRGLNPRVSARIELVIMRAMELPRDARYPSAGAMLAALTSGPLTSEAPGIDQPVPAPVRQATAIMPEAWDQPHPQGAVEPIAPTVRVDEVAEVVRRPEAAPVSVRRGRRTRWLWGALALLLVAAGALYGFGYLDGLVPSLSGPSPTLIPTRARAEFSEPTPVQPTPRGVRPEPTPVEPTPQGMLLVVGTSAIFPPMEFVNDQGDLAGYDIDLMRAVGERADFGVEFRNAPWSDLLPGLEEGRFDAVISSVTINPERAQRFAFSEPYLNAGQVVVVRADSDIESPQGLRGRIAGVQAGTPGVEAVERIGDVDIRLYDDIVPAFEDLAVRRLSAVVCDLPTAARYVKASEGEGLRLRIVGEPLTEELYGIVLRKDELPLFDRVNIGLRLVRESGHEQALVERWLR